MTVSLTRYRCVAEYLPFTHIASGRAGSRTGRGVCWTDTNIDQVDSNKSTFASFATFSKQQQLLTCCSHLAHVGFCARNVLEGEKVEVVLVGSDQQLQLPYLQCLLTDLGALDCCRLHRRIHFGAGGAHRTELAKAAIDCAADAVRMQQVAWLPASTRKQLLCIAQQREQYKGTEDAVVAQGMHMLLSTLETCGEAHTLGAMEGVEGIMAKCSAVVKIGIQNAHAKRTPQQKADLAHARKRKAQQKAEWKKKAKQ